MTTNDVARIVGANVRTELSRCGKTQAELAGLIDRTPMAVSRRVAGKICFNAEELDKIADFLEIPVHRLYAKNADEVA